MAEDPTTPDADEPTGDGPRRSRRRTFVMGLAAVAPAVLSVAVILWVFNLINSWVGPPIQNAIETAVIQANMDDELSAVAKPTANDDGEVTKPDAAQVRDKQLSILRGRSPLLSFYLDWLHPVAGFVVAVLLVYVAGVLVASFIGRRAFQKVEERVTSLPLVRAVYPYAKQVTDFFFSEQRLEYRSVVAIQYPRKGIWSLGLLTGDGMRDVTEESGEPMVNIFIPSSPTPFTGYTIFVPRRDVVPVDLKVDDALRFCVSAGVIIPPHQQCEPVTAPPVPQIEDTDGDGDKTREARAVAEAALRRAHAEARDDARDQGDGDGGGDA